MTTAGQLRDSRVPVPAPGGTARLAGRAVARIGFGAMQLEGRNAGQDTALAVLRQAVGAGVNHIDTAQFYGDCNALIRAALAPYPDDLMLVSKVGAVRDGGGGLVPAQRPHELRAQVEANLAALAVERLGVVNLRRADTAPGIVAEGDQLVDIDDQLAELAALRDEGTSHHYAPPGPLAVPDPGLTARLRAALPGAVYIYQGEELGLWEVQDIPDELRQDPIFYRTHGDDPGRDGSRVPLPWSGTEPPFGFTPPGASAVPWLPQPKEWRDLTVAAESARADSMLRLYQDALRIRRAEESLGDAPMSWQPSPDGVLAFDRGDGLRCLAGIALYGHG